MVFDADFLDGVLGEDVAGCEEDLGLLLVSVVALIYGWCCSEMGWIAEYRYRAVYLSRRKVEDIGEDILQ